MPYGVAPAGSAVGEDGSSVSAPPRTANVDTWSLPESTTDSVRPSGLSRGSTGASPVGLPLNGVEPSRLRGPSGLIAWEEMLGCAVFTANRNRPSCEISPQHGAVCRSANGELPIDVSVPANP